MQGLGYCDTMELIVTNTCFQRQKNKLTTHESGGTASATDYLLLRGCDSSFHFRCEDVTKDFDFL